MRYRQIFFQDFMDNQEYFYRQISLAQNSDFAYINDIYKYYESILEHDKRAFISICEEKGEIIGCALFRYYSEVGKFFEINVNTRKDYQHSSKKVATNVVSAGLKRFFDGIGDEIYLWVHPTNIPAIKAYEKNGFKKVDVSLDKLSFYDNIKNETVYRCSKLDFLKTLSQEKIKEDKKIVNLS